MASPVVDGDVVIKIKDELISAPYVALTIGLMKKFGVNVEIEGSMDGQPTFKILDRIPHSASLRAKLQAAMRTCKLRAQNVRTVLQIARKREENRCVA